MICGLSGFFSIYFGIFIDKDFYKYTMQRVIRRL